MSTSPTSSRPLAVLTGASSGIGAALAPLLAKDGYDLLLVARRAELLEKTAEACRKAAPGCQAEAFALDATAKDATARLLERAPQAKLLVNNAGFGWFGDLTSAEPDVFRRMIELNITALTLLTQAFAARMAAQGGGVICNIASTAAFQAIPFASVYAATKHYVVAFSEAANFEMRRKGVHVIAFCPGPTKTDFGETAGVNKEAQEQASAVMQTADAVAASCARAIRRRGETRIPGVINNLLYYTGRMAPRALQRWVAASMFEEAARKPAAKS